MKAPRFRMEGGLLFLLLSLLTASCSLHRSRCQNKGPQWTVTYLFTAETVHDKMEIRGNRLVMTCLPDGENQDKPWIAQRPSWPENDLRTMEKIRKTLRMLAEEKFR